MSTEHTEAQLTSENYDTQASPAPPKKRNKWLSAAFNMAVGAGISATVKSCAFGLLACTSAPALATVLVPAAAAGMALSLYSMNRDYQEAKKAGEDSPTFWSWKKFFFSTTTALAGGAVVGFWGDEIKNGIAALFNNMNGTDTAAITAPPEVTTTLTEPAPPLPLPPELMPPTVQPETAQIEPSAGSSDTGDIDVPQYNTPESSAGSESETSGNEDHREDNAQEEQEEQDVYLPTETMEKAAAYLENNTDTPSSVMDRLEPAMNGDPQAQKDIAHYLFNDCYPEEGQKHTAALLAKEAADAGNVQAGEFWNFIRYWGLAGIESNKEEALSAMRNIDTDSARHLAAQWGGDIPMEQVENVDCDDDKNTAAAPASVTESFNNNDETVIKTAAPETESAVSPEPSVAAPQDQDSNGCTAIIDVENGISFLCTIDENINVQEGDKMTIDNPPVSAHGLLKDDYSKIIFGMPRP